MTKILITATAIGLGLWWYKKNQAIDSNDQTSYEPSNDSSNEQPSLLSEIMDTITSAPQNLIDSAKLATGTAQTLSSAGLEIIKQFEGFSAKPYPDHKGYSIGYGHLIKEGEVLELLSIDEATALLLQDVEWAEQAVRTAVSVDLDQNEFDALVSLAFNIGAGAFKKSTLVKKLNSGDFEGAAEQFAVWNRASGAVNTALVRRRAIEADLFNTEVTA